MKKQLLKLVIFIALLAIRSVYAKESVYLPDDVLYKEGVYFNKNNELLTGIISFQDKDAILKRQVRNGVILEDSSYVNSILVANSKYNNSQTPYDQKRYYIDGSILVHGIISPEKDSFGNDMVLGEVYYKNGTLASKSMKKEENGKKFVFTEVFDKTGKKIMEINALNNSFQIYCFFDGNKKKLATEEQKNKYLQENLKLYLTPYTQIVEPDFNCEENLTTNAHKISKSSKEDWKEWEKLKNGGKRIFTVKTDKATLITDKTGEKTKSSKIANGYRQDIVYDERPLSKKYNEVGYKAEIYNEKTNKLLFKYSLSDKTKDADYEVYDSENKLIAKRIKGEYNILDQKKFDEFRSIRKMVK